MPTIIHHPDQIDFDKPGKHHYQVAFHLDSGWGYSLVPLTVINGTRPASSGENPPGLAAFGGTHGNEWEGQIAIKQLCQELHPDQISGRVILMPQLSQSACAANQRVSPFDGVNMNRAFPGNLRGSLSYRIAHFVKSYVFPRVRVVVDVHAGGREGGFALCTSFHPVPDPAQFAEIGRVAALFDTPFMLVYSSQMASGLLTDEAEAEGKIAIGGEFGFGESVNRRGVLHAVTGIQNVLRHYNMLAGDIVRIDSGRNHSPLLVDARNLEDYTPCPQDGIWEPLVDLGDRVQKYQLIGRVHSFSDHTVAALELRAHRDGIMIMMCGTAQCRQGTTLFVIAAPVDHGTKT
ncbi:MAG TPA: succinylglutamate desuccinylase/aspartoacylase family protein [Alloacidobacterium sp.]|jgi:predicted deacylase|nr:succinylglutamate desuccinylase/aspartoacylase family protein [Alloacidobacterium sp.]